MVGAVLESTDLTLFSPASLLWFRKKAHRRKTEARPHTSPAREGQKQRGRHIFRRHSLFLLCLERRGESVAPEREQSAKTKTTPLSRKKREPNTLAREGGGKFGGGKRLTLHSLASSLYQQKEDGLKGHYSRKVREEILLHQYCGGRKQSKKEV